MKFAVIQFPGSNCDIDLYEALHTVCGADVAYVPSKESSLDGFDAVMLPRWLLIRGLLESRRYCPLYQYHARYCRNGQGRQAGLPGPATVSRS